MTLKTYLHNQRHGHDMSVLYFCVVCMLRKGRTGQFQRFCAATAAFFTHSIDTNVQSMQEGLCT